MKKLKLLLVLFFIFQFTFAQLVSGSFSWDGEIREYTLFIPSGYDSTTNVPLVLALHGLGDKGSGFVNFIRLNPVASRENFIVAYPTALPDAILMGNGWNVTLNPANTADDLGFLAAMIDSIIAKYQIDRDRIYATGFSLGGFMANRLGCELSDHIAAIASLSGTIPTNIISNCKPDRVIPALHMHGTADGTIPYSNTLIFGIQNVGADSTARFWANHNGCFLTPTVEQLPDIRPDGYTIQKFTYSNCNDSSEVLLYEITGAPHTIMQTTNDVSAAEEIWDFFNRHKKREPIPSGITEISEPIFTYPNPFSSYITVDMEMAQIRELSIYDLLGKEVLNFKNIDFRKSLNLKTDQLQSGVYFLKLDNPNTTYVQKIVKQN